MGSRSGRKTAPAFAYIQKNETTTIIIHDFVGEIRIFMVKLI